MDLLLLRKYDAHALEFVVGYAAVASAAVFTDVRNFRNNVVSSVQSCTHVGHDVLSVHGAHGHYYILNGEIATHPSSAQVLGDRRREAVALKKQQDTAGWRRRSDLCPVSSGSVVRR